MSTEYDTFEHGIGLTTLAADSLATETPIDISGVAIPEQTILQGGRGEEHFYTPTAAQRAADILQQQIDDGDTTVHLVKNFHELDGQASADDIIGEVTAARYSEGVGVVFSAELTDMDIAQKIEHGYLDVSPTVARSLGDFDETMQARAVDEVAGFRDIAVVGQGQPGAEVEIGANPAIEALSRQIQVDTLSVSEPEFTGYDTSPWDAPTLEGTYGGDMDAARNAATWVRNGGETFGDLSLFVLTGDGELNLNGLDAAWRMAPQTDGPDDSDVDRLRRMYEEMAEEANDAGALSDAEFDDVWQDRGADTDTSSDPMSLDDATETIADEYDVDADTVAEHLDALDSDEDETDDNVVVLIDE